MENENITQNQENITGKRRKKFSLPSMFAGVGIGILLSAAAVLILTGGFGGLKANARFAALLNTIRRYYIAEYDVEDVTDAALAGAVSSLDDNWSYYMNAEEYEAYKETSANKYHGIGVTVTKDEETGGFIVLSVTDESPAQLAGIEAGDIMLAVDGTDVTGEDTVAADVSEMINADYNAQAEILLLRADGTRETVTVDCVEIYNSPVDYSMLDGSIGYIRIENFREGTAQKAEEAIEDLLSQGAEKLIFDVRSDPGGHLTELTDLLDYILPEGNTFIRISRSGDERIFTSDEACIEVPMAVLVDGNSYSAAEFFAAALSEYDWATIVGTQTTGKSRVQVTVNMPDGGALHISHYRYLTPERRDLYEEGGLVPDITVELDEEQATLFASGQLDPEDDPQVQAAVDAVS